MSQDKAKRAAAAAALDFIKSGMTLGLGTGSTAEHFVRLLGAASSRGLEVTGVATSKRTEELAQSCGIAVSDLDRVDRLDLAVDGADEADEAFRLIKGGGGALLREKLVASVAEKVLILIDPTKQVDTLGRFPLAVEIVAFGARHTLARLTRLLHERVGSHASAKLRADRFGEPFVTDEGNFIVDVACQAIVDAEGLAGALKATTGVIEHGLFIGLCDAIILGRPDGTAITLGA